MGPELTSGDRVSIPVVDQLIPGGVKPGAVVLVEFDPASQWFSLATTILAGFLKVKNHASYVCQIHSPTGVKENLSRLGVDVEQAIMSDLLDLDDFHSATLTGGRLENASTEPERTREGIRFHSLRVQDLSLAFLKTSKGAPEKTAVVNVWPPGSLVVDECLSSLARFNEEKPLLEWYESRVCPELRRVKRITMVGLSRGIHSDWFYNRFEGFTDGVIDIQLREHEEEIKNFLRVRNLRGQPHNSKWHEIEIKENGEAVLVS
jgi:KaiC/GvpD/RAD55 family RecA-like ATPase